MIRRMRSLRHLELFLDMGAAFVCDNVTQQVPRSNLRHSDKPEAKDAACM